MTVFAVDKLLEVLFAGSQLRDLLAAMPKQPSEQAFPMTAARKGPEEQVAGLQGSVGRNGSRYNTLCLGYHVHYMTHDVQKYVYVYVYTYIHMYICI